MNLSAEQIQKLKQEYQILLEQREKLMRELDPPAEDWGMMDTAADLGLRAWDYGAGALRTGVGAPLEMAAQAAQGKMPDLSQQGQDLVNTLKGAAPTLLERYNRTGLPKGPGIPSSLGLLEEGDALDVTPAGAVMTAADMILSPRSAIRALKRLRPLPAPKTAQRLRVEAERAKKLRESPRSLPSTAWAELKGAAQSIAKGSPWEDAQHRMGTAYYSSADPMRVMDTAARVRGRSVVPSQVLMDEGVWGNPNSLYSQVRRKLKETGDTATGAHILASGAAKSVGKPFTVPLIGPGGGLNKAYGHARDLLDSNHPELRAVGKNALEELNQTTTEKIIRVPDQIEVPFNPPEMPYPYPQSANLGLIQQLPIPYNPNAVSIRVHNPDLPMRKTRKPLGKTEELTPGRNIRIERTHMPGLDAQTYISEAGDLASDLGAYGSGKLSAEAAHKVNIQDGMRRAQENLYDDLTEELSKMELKRGGKVDPQVKGLGGALYQINQGYTGLKHAEAATTPPKRGWRVNLTPSRSDLIMGIPLGLGVGYQQESLGAGIAAGLGLKALRSTAARTGGGLFMRKSAKYADPAARVGLLNYFGEADKRPNPWTLLHGEPVVEEMP